MQFLLFVSQNYRFVVRILFLVVDITVTVSNFEHE